MVRFPWSKRKETNDMVSTMKQALVESLQSQMAFNFGLSGIQSPASKLVTTILGNKKVPIVTADSKEEEEDQNRIYTNMMSIVNGDRDAIYQPPDEIGLKAFANDTLTPDERNEVYETVNAINEANDLNYMSIYGVDRRPAEEPQEDPTPEVKPAINVGGVFMNVLQPFMGMIATFCAYITAIFMMTKMTSLLDKI